MAIINVEKNTYKAESLYQWDVNQELKIYGLSLSSIPEIHFTNEAMTRAIVRQASMDSAGVITVNVPNSLLQKPYKIKAYVCIYSGNTFESLYKIEIPVKARTQPGDYTLVNDEEVYSFNALENQIVNALSRLDKETSTATSALNAATVTYKESKTAYDNARAEVETAVDEAVEIAMSALPTLTAEDIRTICE